VFSLVQPGFSHCVLVQDVLADADWAEALTSARPDPAVWAHVAPYGEVKLDMGRHLALRADHAAVGESR
jgi:hypothetical protein